MIKPDLSAVWVYLQVSPLLWLMLTLAAYYIGDLIHRRSGRNPMANTVMIAVILLVPTLLLLNIPYATYFSGAQFVHFLLGPATVALAIPLYRVRALILRTWIPTILSLLAGSLTAILSAVGVAWLMGASLKTTLSLAPKSVTTPIAMGISEKIGGEPTLTAVLVIVTGILGAMLSAPLLNGLGIKDKRARGMAVGIAAHGIGTARGLQVHPVIGAFAGLAMALNGLATSLLIPLLMTLIR